MEKENKKRILKRFSGNFETIPNNEKTSVNPWLVDGAGD